MKLTTTLAVIVAAVAPLSLSMATPAGAENSMEISPDESRPATSGSTDTFTGQVSVKPLFNPNAVRNTGAAEVSRHRPAPRSGMLVAPAGHRQFRVR